MTTWTNLSEKEKELKVDEWCALAPQFDRMQIVGLARFTNGMRTHKESSDDWFAHNSAYAATYNGMLKQQGGNGSIEIAGVISEYIK